MDNKHLGMTVNERLYVSGLMNEFDKAVKEKNVDKIMNRYKQYNPEKKSMKLVFFITLLPHISVSLDEQQLNNLNPQFDNPVPPSPNASAIGKFGSIPVGLSTGIPQINIPIYQYQNKNSGLSLSVSLDYYAGA